MFSYYNTLMFEYYKTMWHDSDRRDDDESNFQRTHQHTPITIHNIRKLMLA